MPQRISLSLHPAEAAYIAEVVARMAKMEGEIAGIRKAVVLRSGHLDANLVDIRPDMVVIEIPDPPPAAEPPADPAPESQETGDSEPVLT